MKRGQVEERTVPGNRRCAAERGGGSSFYHGATPTYEGGHAMAENAHVPGTAEPTAEVGSVGDSRRFGGLLRDPLAWTAAGGFVFLFACADVRHALLQSSAYDLGIFDQAVWLISRGEVPFSSFMGMHILGDHAAFVLYLLAPLYLLWANVHWLFAVQAAAFAIAAWAVHVFAVDAGIDRTRATVLAGCFLVSPLVFNANLFDFHPETLAAPALLWAVVFARRNCPIAFALCVALALGSKEAVALNVVGLGIWLAFFERRRRLGLATAAAGFVWFAIAAVWAVPSFSGSHLAAMARYGYLGATPWQAIVTVFTRPGVALGHLLSFDRLVYLASLVGAVPLLLPFRSISPLIGAVPTLLLNCLADYDAQRSLSYQYALPMVPFLALAVIGNVASGTQWLRRPRTIVLVSVAAFLAFADHQRFWRTYLDSPAYLRAAHRAIAMVPPDAAVLTTSELAPHLSQRRTIRMIDAEHPDVDVGTFDALLVSLRHPGWRSSVGQAMALLDRARRRGDFEERFRGEGVILVVKRQRATR